MFQYEKICGLAEAHWITSDTYGKTAISDRTCWSGMVPTFKVLSGDFAVEDPHSGGREKFVEDAELEASDSRVKLKKNYRNHWVGISEQAILKRLKQLGMIEKEEYWVLHNLKSRGDVERRLFACEQLVERQTRKGFLRPIVIGHEKWVSYNNPKRYRKSWGLPSGHTGRISMAQKSCLA
nr:Mariner Mos1 transposase [Hymenolepis microstoma]CUU97805.1 Mariner Mos1 transposase [Hymenolepis microstoma]